MARCFAAALIRRIDPKTGARQLLIIHYQPVVTVAGERVKKGGFQIKFPGGKQEWHESPRQTVRRECIAETGLIIRGQKQFCTIEITDGPQHYFLTDFDRCKGKLRTGRDYHDQNADLGPPTWVDEDKLERLLHPNHRVAFRVYIKLESRPAQIHI